MKILFLMISYPDQSSNTNMYTDLTSEFLIHGHDVYVAAPDNVSTALFLEGGIKVLRIKTMPLFNTSSIKKGIANLMLPFQYKRAIDRYLNNIHFELIITSTPPITFIDTIRYLKNKYKSKVYLILRDIFPQNAKDLGLIRSSLIFNYFRKKEKKLYKLVDSIGCMSPKNIKFVNQHNQEITLSKLHLLPNWVKVNETENLNFEIKSKLNLQGKFIAVFGGNFGIPQQMEFIVEVAERLSSEKDIIFLLVGDGTEKEKIRSLILEKKTDNIRIFDRLQRDMYLKLLKECDVGLVNLSDKFSIPNIPSRTLSYWAVKLPVLAAVDKHTDYGDLLENSEGGLWSLTGDHEKYISNLLFLYNNPEKRKQMGENGYNYLVRELSPENIYNIIMSQI